MTSWNSSRAVQPQLTGTSSDGSWISSNLGKTFDATQGYDWNVTIPTDLSGSAQGYVIGDKVVGVDVQADEVKTWALNLKSGQEGQLLYSHSWKAPSSWPMET